MRAGLESVTTTNKMAEGTFFGTCSEEKLKDIRGIAKTKLCRVVQEHQGNFFDIPDTILDVYEDWDLGIDPKASKPATVAKLEKSVAEMIRRLGHHLLGCLVPGQVVIIEQLEEVRKENSQLRSGNDQILAELNSSKAQIEVLRRVQTAQTERINNNAESMKDHTRDLKLVGLEVNNLREELYQIVHQNKLPGQAKGKVNQENRGIRMRQPEPEIKKDRSGNILPGGGYDDLQCSNGLRNKFDTSGFNIDEPEHAEPEAWPHQGGYLGPKKSNNDKKKGKSSGDQGNQGNQGNQRNQRRKPETEKVQLSNNERWAAKEVLIHKKAHQSTTEFKLEKEAESVSKALEELKIEYLGSQWGVDVDIDKDINYHDRIEGHHDEKNGCQPIRLRFHTITICDKVKKAAKRAGCLYSRRPVNWGKYAEPYARDLKGHKITPDPEAIKKAKGRPDFFFRPSLTKEQRLKIKSEKERNGGSENSEKKTEWKAKVEERNARKCKYGNIRNFDNCDADLVAEDDKRKISERKRKEQEDKTERERVNAEKRAESVRLANEKAEELAANAAASAILKSKAGNDQ